MMTLTKRMIAMITELMCPSCRGELTQLNRLHYYCTTCKIDYHGEEKAGSNAGT